MNFFRRLFPKKAGNPTNPLGLVSVELGRVVYIRPNKTEVFLWSDLIEVGIVTTDEGPVAEDVIFVLIGPDYESGIAVPQGATGTDSLLRRIQSLPGFDNQAVIDAMCSTSNSRFTCWKKNNE